MDFRISTLADVHDHSLAVSGWEQVYRQMTPGRFQSTLVQASSNDFHFFRETTNRRVAQHGVSPAGLASIAVPLYAPLVGTFQGPPVSNLTTFEAEALYQHTTAYEVLIGIQSVLQADLKEGFRSALSTVLQQPIDPRV